MLKMQKEILYRCVTYTYTYKIKERVLTVKPLLAFLMLR